MVEKARLDHSSHPRRKSSPKLDGCHENLAKTFSANGVVLAYLFGSQAEGTARLGSDIDIAVLLRPEIPREKWPGILLKLIAEVTQALGRDDVDVVLLNQAPASLAFQVIRHGWVIYEDEHTRPAVDFASRTIVRHADTAHLREIKQQYLKDWIEEHRRLRRTTPASSGQE